MQVAGKLPSAPDAPESSGPPAPAVIVRLRRAAEFDSSVNDLASCCSLGAVFIAVLSGIAALLILVLLLAMLIEGHGTDGGGEAYAGMLLIPLLIISWLGYWVAAGFSLRRAEQRWNAEYRLSCGKLKAGNLASLLLDDLLLAEALAEHSRSGSVRLPANLPPRSAVDRLYFALAAWDSMLEYRKGNRSALVLNLQSVIFNYLRYPAALDLAGPYSYIEQRARLAALIDFIYEDAAKANLSQAESPPAGTYAHLEPRGYDIRLTPRQRGRR